MRSKKTAFGVMVGLGLALIVASQAATAGLDHSAVDAILEDPVAATVEAFDPHGEGDDRIRDAMKESAYRWSLTLLSEQVATKRAQATWQEAREEPEPYEAYGQRLQDWSASEMDGVADVLAGLQQKESDGPTRAEFERLLFAAHYVALAESSLTAARATLETAAEDPEHFYDSSIGRRTVAYPIAQGAVFLHAAGQVLDRFTPAPESPPMEIHPLQHFLDEYGLGQSGWTLDAHGIAHMLGRQLVVFERNVAADWDTANGIDTSLDRLADQLVPLQANGFTGARLMAVTFDVSWWTQDADDDGEQGDPSPAHQQMEARLAAAVVTANHEVDILMSSVPLEDQEAEKQSGSSSVWPPLSSIAIPMVAGIALLALIGVVAATRVTARRRKPATNRRIEKLRGRRKGPSGGLLVLILAGMVAASGFAFSDDADGALSGSAPVPDPVIVTPNDRHSFYLDVLADADDQVHFAWGECLDPPDEGCSDGRMVMMYRTYDPYSDSWGDAKQIVQPPEGQDAYLPVLKETTDGIALIWLQGVAADTRSSPPTDHPAEVWMCIIEDGACKESQRLSAAGAGVESAAAAVGPDGLLRVAWAEASGQEGRVVFRQQTTDGWKESVGFDEGGDDQRQPAVAVTQDGTAHVVWLAYPLPEEPVYRVVYYASVDGATNEASSSEYASQHMLTTEGAALESKADALHLVYGTERGLYHRVLEDEEWTDPQEVSQSDHRTRRPDIATTEEGIAVVWMELGHPGPPFRLRMAEHVEGMWLRPDEVIDAPHRAMSMPKVDADATDLLHLAWPGRTTDEGSVRPYYKTLSSDHEDDVAPPEIGTISPQDESWISSDPVELDAQVNLSAPLEHDDTKWLVNGELVDYDAADGVLSVSIAGLPEGTHDVQLTVTDRAGNSDQKDWVFHIDRTQPQFTVRIVDENGDDAEGWSPGPVRVEGEIISEDGAPARVEVQATHPEDGSILRLGENEQRWVTVASDDGITLPEGFLLDVTVRARDEAGNINFGETVQVGWDPSAPSLGFDVPDWFTSKHLTVPVESMNRTIGAPVNVHAELVPVNDGGDVLEAIAKVAAGKTGSLDFESLEDGHYELRIQGIRSDAGHSQDPVPGPWSIGVDTVPPELSARDTGGGFDVEAIDRGSGIALLRVAQHGETIAEANREPASANASVQVPSDLLLEPVLIIAGDVAGNWNRMVLNADGTLEEHEEPDATDNESVDRDVDWGGFGVDSNNQEGPDEDLSGPAVLLVPLLVAWLLVARRRRPKSRK